MELLASRLSTGLEVWILSPDSLGLLLVGAALRCFKSFFTGNCSGSVMRSMNVLQKKATSHRAFFTPNASLPFSIQNGRTPPHPQG